MMRIRRRACSFPERPAGTMPPTFRQHRQRGQGRAVPASPLHLPLDPQDDALHGHILSRDLQGPALRKPPDVSKLVIYLRPIFKSMMITFQELTDEQWEYIKPHLLPQSGVGRKRACDRKTINVILYVLITGCTWHDMPRRYGSGVTAWRRL